jgi:hypothetical protein
MAIGSMLGQRIFPVSCEEWCFLGLGVPAKQLRSWRKRMGVERESTEWGGVGWESKVSAQSTPNPSHGTKMLGKMLLTKKAHEKSLMSKSKV